MLKFGKFDKKQIALVLSLASVLGVKAQAMNTNKNQVKRSQSLGAVGGATSKNNSNLLASPKMLKKSKSMSTLSKVGIGVGVVLAAVELANEGAGVFTNADTWYKGKFSIANAARHIFGGDNMKPEEKQALAGKIVDVIDTFDINKIGEFELPKYEGNELKDEEKEAYDKKYDEACVKAVKEIKDKQGNSYIDRVDVKEYSVGGVSGGIMPSVEKYKALDVLNWAYDRKLLSDLKSGDFKYDERGAKKVSFAKDKIRIDWGDDEFAGFELQKDGKLKVNYVAKNYDGNKKLITEFTLEKPKNEELKK